VESNLLSKDLGQLEDGGGDILTGGVAKVGGQAGNRALPGDKGLNSEADKGNLQRKQINLGSLDKT
jgi:hypothetical protein